MSENLDAAAMTADLPAEPAQRLRELVEHFARAAAEGRAPLWLPPHPAAWPGRGQGHFHLAAELFLQVSGTTRFVFPHAERLLQPGEMLLVPPKLLHDEHVRAAGPAPAQAFQNLVIHADAGSLCSHLAHEAQPGRPGILHLEVRGHAQVARIQDWLADAALPGEEGDAALALQRRALVAAALAGVRRVLEAGAATEVSVEPPLLARARSLIRDRLGDHTLSVRDLAAHCGCSADYLSHLFHRHAGETLAAHIVRLRLDRAERLLADEAALAVKEVAWACGFASSGYFIRTFRARHGLTPAVWRQARPSRPAGATEAAVPTLPFVPTRERPCRWARLPGDEADDGRPDTAA